MARAIALKAKGPVLGHVEAARNGQLRQKEGNSDLLKHGAEVAEEVCTVPAAARTVNAHGDVAVLALEDVDGVPGGLAFGAEQDFPQAV